MGKGNVVIGIIYVRMQVRDAVSCPLVSSGNEAPSCFLPLSWA